MLHIKWTDKITHQRVLLQAEEVRSLVAKIKERKNEAETYYKES